MANFGDTVTLPALETPLFGTKFSSISHKSRAVANFVLKFQIYVSVWQISLNDYQITEQISRPHLLYFSLSYFMQYEELLAS